MVYRVIRCSYDCGSQGHCFNRVRSVQISLVNMIIHLLPIFLTIFFTMSSVSGDTETTGHCYFSGALSGRLVLQEHEKEKGGSDVKVKGVNVMGDEMKAGAKHAYHVHEVNHNELKVSL